MDETGGIGSAGPAIRSAPVKATDPALNIIVHLALPVFAGMIGGLLGGGGLGNRMIWALSVAGATEFATLVIRGCMVGAQKLNGLDDSIGKTGNTIVFQEERKEEIYDPGVLQLINTGNYYLAMVNLRTFGDSPAIDTDKGMKYYKEQYGRLVEKWASFDENAKEEFLQLKGQHGRLFPPKAQ